jgi:hypothetical protein
MQNVALTKDQRPETKDQRPETTSVLYLMSRINSKTKTYVFGKFIVIFTNFY